MKKFRHSHLLRMPTATDKTVVSAAPFSGKDPIRWQVLFTENNKLAYSYIGKPCMAVVRKVEDIFRNRRGGLVIKEFDRKTVFSYSRQNVRPGDFRTPVVTNYNSELLRLYRPYTTENPMLWAYEGIRRAVLETKGKKFYCYLTPNMGGVTDEHWREHRKWLRNRLR
jgi:hypothetical protein